MGPSSADLNEQLEASAEAEAGEETCMHERLQSYLQRVRRARFRAPLVRQCGEAVLLSCSADELLQLRLEPELARLVLAVRHKWSGA